MESPTYYELVAALNMFFEYDTTVRFERLWKALHGAMQELKMERLGWACGYRLREEYRKRAERVWGHTITIELEDPWDGQGK